MAKRFGLQGKGMSEDNGTPPEDHNEDGVRRRDFIEIAAVSAAGVGGLVMVYPLVSQMAPSADVLAESTTELDISSLEIGQSVRAVYRKQPVFIRQLTQAEIDEANAVPADSLRDPETLAERTQEGHESLLVVIGICTHLGCVPLGGAEGEEKGEFNGYFCPCHGSHYDTAARIRKGPAPTNLVVPEHTITDSILVIGQG